MPGNALKHFLVRQLKHRPIGVPAAVASRWLGARTLSRKISRECGYVPPVAVIDIPRSLGGGRFRMDSCGRRDQVVLTNWLYGWDAFEKPMPELLGACSRSARRILDVGAYSGFYSLLGATCNPRAEVVAFEPFPLAREALTRNVALNGLESRIRIVPAAVSDRSRRAEFYIPPNEHGWIETSSSLDVEYRGQHEAVIEVDVVTLDSIRYQEGVTGPVDLMKVDAEQVEHQVLEGGRRMLTDDRPLIFLEVLPCNEHLPRLEAIREQLGYVGGAMHPAGVDWRQGVEPVDVGTMHASNHVLCPAEKQAWLDDLIRSLGYRISRMELPISDAAAPARR